MKVVYSEEQKIEKKLQALQPYVADVARLVSDGDFTKNESSLATWNDGLMREGVARVAAAVGPVKHVVLIGIGGSSLGTEAIHAALRGPVVLHVLDAVAPYKMKEVLKALTGVPKEELAICVVSKSGNTTETLANTSVCMAELGKVYGEQPFDRLIAVGNPGNTLLTTVAQFGSHILPMHEAIGGRYSVFTAASLVPLRLLGYDTDALLEGASSISDPTLQQQAAVGAATLHQQLESGVRSVNFFAFDTRLEKLGRWYRQLTAESIGKEKDRDGHSVTIGFVPTISTPVELHSIGQLYFSGFDGVYTDFVTLSDTQSELGVLPTCKVAPTLQNKSLTEVADAIFGGVIGAYQKRKLPYRLTTLEGDMTRELGKCMAVRMLETMCLANLMNVDAFDQPNVELYKSITRNILDKS